MDTLVSFFSRGLQLVKKNPAILTSLLLIVFIPSFLFFHTRFIINSFQKSFDQTITQQGRLLGIILDGFIDDIENASILQEIIERITEQDSRIKALTFSLPIQKEGQLVFRVIAALDPQDIQRDLTQAGNVLAWNEDSAFGSRHALQGERFWLITTPLHSESGEKIGLAHIALSLEPVDILITQTVSRSYLILAMAIVVILLLIANHARLFEYALLFKKLKEAEQMKDEFISIASHELRTPITGIKSFLSLAREGDFGTLPKELREGLNQAIQSTEQLDALIEDILDVSRIEQGRLTLEKSATDIIPLCKEAINSLRMLASEKGLELKESFPEKSIILLLDPKRFKQILVNLIGNSIKYTQEGWVLLEVKENILHKQVEIRISDSGLGISAQDQERLFQKFFRARDTQARRQRGTGLGLWITRQLVEMMQGKIFIESIKGKGSVFSVIFAIKEK